MAWDTRVQSQGESYQRLKKKKKKKKKKKMVLDTSLLNTQHYKIEIQSKVEQSIERSSALSYTLKMKRESLGHPQLHLPTLLTLYIKTVFGIK